MELAYSMARNTFGELPDPRDRHHHVAGLREVLQLLDEDAIVADVVGVGRDRGQGIGQRHDAEALIAAEARALHHVAGEVRRGGGAAAVAADENVAILRRGPA